MSRGKGVVTGGLAAQVERAARGQSVADAGPGRVAGLRVMVLQSGRRKWQFRYRQDGKQRTATIGDYPEMKAKDARAAARAIASGLDAGRVVRTDRTLADAWAQFQEDKGARLSHNTLRDYRSIWSNHLAELGGRRLTDIRGGEAIDLHNRMLRAGITTKANRAVGLLSAIWGHAERRGWIDRGRNPARAVERVHEQPRKRVMSDDEVSRFLRAVEAAEASGAERREDTLLLLLVLFTARRVGHLRELRWGQVDLDAGVLEIGDPKGEALARRGQIRPADAGPRPQLSAPLVARFRALAGPAADAWVFPSKQDPAKHVHDVRGPWRRLARAASLPRGLRPYDLKKTGSSIARDLGFSAEQISSYQGTRDRETVVKHYAHASERQARDVGDAVAEAAEKLLRGNVVPLSKAR